jgi:hypothetical protein
MTRILLVNPPIYDFAAYDFWIKPYGLLSVAGYIRGKAEFRLFDYLNRAHPLVAEDEQLKSDRWGRGKFPSERLDRPACLELIPRYYQRFGLGRNLFKEFLEAEQRFDFVLIQTVMTYWYPGVAEVIEDVRQAWPEAKVILGGNYATLRADHARSLGADLVVEGTDLGPLWDYLNLEPDMEQPGLWESYDTIHTGALRLSDGCPFNCTYCTVPKVYSTFASRPMDRSLADVELLVERGVENIAFYDDALLFDSDNVLMPFLEDVLRRDIRVNFHSPNGFHARLVTRDLAKLMVRAGFKTFYLGFESTSIEWQKRTGSKVFSNELAQAVDHLLGAGAGPQNITAYQILGHPDNDSQKLEDSMRFVNSLGIRGMLADFSPIPGTPDGEKARTRVDMDEPLMHNKSAFGTILLGFDEVNRLKDLQRKLNRNVPHESE